MPEAPPAVGSAIVAQSVGRLLKDSCQLKYSVHDINIEPSPHQLRVSQSLAKLNVPAWYSDRPSKNCTDNLKWKRSDRSSRSSWRRKCGTQSCAVTRPTTPDNISLSSSTITLRNLSASRSNFRWSYFGGKENARDPQDGTFNNDINTNTTSSTAEALSTTLGAPELTTKVTSTPQDPASLKSTYSCQSYKQPYFGWRSQERLKLAPGYLSTPSQRLASSLLHTARLSRIAE